MSSIALRSLNSSPVGRTIISHFSDLDNGKYALVPDEKSGRTKVLKLTKSFGTDFYKYFSTVNVPFSKILETNLIPTYFVELNASPAGSESQEYAKALVFAVA